MTLLLPSLVVNLTTCSPMFGIFSFPAESYCWPHRDPADSLTCTPGAASMGATEFEPPEPMVPSTLTRIFLDFGFPGEEPALP
eukprot:108071-Heterocapsa_arctica.AAC.1